MTVGSNTSGHLFDTSLNADGVLYANGTGVISSTTVGASGQILTSNGAAVAPTFQAASASGAVTTITGNSGGGEVPSSGNFNVLGTGSITVAGSANTETVQLTGLTNHNVLVGAGTATVTKVSPSATSGVPLVSQGASSDPSFSTAVVAGGGTGATSLTAYAVMCGGTTATGTVQSVASVGTSGQILTSNGAAALPTFQTSTGITGPGSSTNNSIATWNGTGGTALFSRGTPLVDSTGRMTNTNQPAFLAYLSSSQSNVTGDGTVYRIPYDTIVYDVGSNFTTGASALYTFPVTGKYLIIVETAYVNFTGVNAIMNLVCTSRGFTTSFNTLVASSFNQYHLSAIVDATASDTAFVNLTVSSGAKTDNVTGGGSPYATYICGYLVC